MYGDIIYVGRKPVLFRSIKERTTQDARLIDRLIVRFTYYRHYGIEVENGYVIHFHSTSYHTRRYATVKKVPIEDFLIGGKASILRPVGNRYSREETVARAYAALGEALVPYSIHRNNCEHFAMWCATGNSHSGQAYFFEKGQDVLLYPTKVTGKVVGMIPHTMSKVGPFTKRTTIRVGKGLYNKILNRA